MRDLEARSLLVTRRRRDLVLAEHRRRCEIDLGFAEPSLQQLASVFCSSRLRRRSGHQLRPDRAGISSSARPAGVTAISIRRRSADDDDRDTKPRPTSRRTTTDTGLCVAALGQLVERVRRPLGQLLQYEQLREADAHLQLDRSRVDTERAHDASHGVHRTIDRPLVTQRGGAVRRIGTHGGNMRSSPRFYKGAIGD